MIPMKVVNAILAGGVAAIFVLSIWSLEDKIEQLESRVNTLSRERSHAAMPDEDWRINKGETVEWVYSYGPDGTPMWIRKHPK